jgi:hypothetical protein
MNNPLHYVVLMIICILIVSVLACPNPVPPPTSNGYKIYDYMLLDPSQTLTFNNLAKGDRLLVIPLHTVASESSAVLHNAMTMNVAYSGGAPAGIGPLHESASIPDFGQNGETPLLDIAIKSVTPYSAGSFVSGKAAARQTRAYAVGDAETFWIIADMSASMISFVTCGAKLLYEGTKCHVFLSDTIAVNANATKIATQVGQQFDSSIHAKANALFGYEWGGDPRIPADIGGIDGDPKVFIFIQDQTLNCGGYFDSSDEYLDSVVTRPERSNEKEIIYVILTGAQMDSSVVPLDTIAHEFQHMINFNELYRKRGLDQWAIINEGFSQTCETLCGYGPEISRLAYLQSKPAISYTAWHFTQLPYNSIYAYSAGYAIIEYAVRRFGSNFTNAVYHGSTAGIAGVESALSSVGYIDGYKGLVLDMLTAHYLDRDFYSYPSAGLYSGDTGIDLDSTTPRWYAVGPSTRSGLLRGLSTKFYNTYPQSFDVQLYDYGADAYEFASGTNGTITFTLSNVQPNIVLRVVHLKASGREKPDIDGRLGDWTGYPFVAGTDAQNDNDLNSSGLPTGVSGLSCTDMTGFRAFISNDVLYGAIETRTLPATTVNDGYYILLLDVTGTGEWDYYLYFYDDEFRVYTCSPFTMVTRNTSGVKYSVSDAVEFAIPLTLFGDTLKNPVFIRPYSVSYVNDDWRWDLPDQNLTVSR